MNYALIQTEIGSMIAVSNGKALVRLEFDNGMLQELLQKKYLQEGNTWESFEDEILTQTRNELGGYFNKNIREFSIPTMPAGTDFQKRVWQELQTIPYGRYRTYAQQATALGDIKAIRAVASANGKNPIAIIIPCHRILGTDGSLTGYAGGLDKKKWLLEHEDILIKQPELFG